MALIVNMIGRNEEARYLETVLTHVKEYADKIIFTDDDSTDQTAQIAINIGAHVQLIKPSMFCVDESALRQQAWNFMETYAKEGDWILDLDCDEILYGINSLPTLLQQKQYSVIQIMFYHMWNATEYRIDKAWRPSIQPRLFRFVRGGQFPNKKLACGSTPKYVLEWARKGSALTANNLRIQHLGYQNDIDKKMKYDRYMELDGGRYHSLQHLKSILDESPELVRW